MLGVKNYFDEHRNEGVVDFRKAKKRGRETGLFASPCLSVQPT